jgi:hypothetical protein
MEEHKPAFIPAEGNCLADVPIMRVPTLLGLGKPTQEDIESGLVPMGPIKPPRILALRAAFDALKWLEETDEGQDFFEGEIQPWLESWMKDDKDIDCSIHNYYEACFAAVIVRHDEVETIAALLHGNTSPRAVIRIINEDIVLSFRMNLAIQTGREGAAKEMGRKGAINRHLYERKDGLDERDRKIVEEYKSGMLPKSIAKKFALSVSQVRRILKKPI